MMKWLVFLYLAALDIVLLHCLWTSALGGRHDLKSTRMYAFHIGNVKVIN